MYFSLYKILLLEKNPIPCKTVEQNGEYIGQWSSWWKWKMCLLVFTEKPKELLWIKLAFAVIGGGPFHLLHNLAHSTLCYSVHFIFLSQFVLKMEHFL